MTGNNENEIDGRDLRHAFGSFATGVTIVTTLDDEGSPCGFTANSFASVSIDPPLLLVNIAKSAYGCSAFTRSSGFVVNILAHSQRELSNLFASAGVDKFATVDWQAAATGSPIIADVIAWFDCEHFQQVDAGDHIILIGKVVGYDHNTHAPLGFCRGAYVSFGLSPEMLQLVSSPGTLKVGALIESNGKILLERNPENGQLSPPIADIVGDVNQSESLVGKLSSAGIEADLPFIYSAYHQGSVRFVYYRGELRSVKDVIETRALQFYDFDHITWEEINDPAIINMLERFVREKRMGTLGIYIGSDTAGEVHPAG